jgi:hypothetical protein
MGSQALTEVCGQSSMLGDSTLNHSTAHLAEVDQMLVDSPTYLGVSTTPMGYQGPTGACKPSMPDNKTLKHSTAHLAEVDQMMVDLPTGADDLHKGPHHMTVLAQQAAGGSGVLRVLAAATAAAALADHT